MRPHLRFILRPALTSLVAASTLIVGACNSAPKAAHVDPALSTLVPSDITLLAGIHVEDLLKTSLYQKHLAQQSIPQLDEFARRTGLDVRTQVWEVLFLSDGKASAILGRGKFSNEAEPRLPESAVPPGSTRFGYKTYNFTGTDQTAVVFMSPTVAGVGDTGLLKRVIDSRDQTNGPPPLLAERMKEIPPDAAIWAVSSGVPFLSALSPNTQGKGDGPRGKGKQAPTGNNITASIGNLAALVNSTSLYLDLRPGGIGRASTTSANEADAKQMRDALAGLVGLARLAGNSSTSALVGGDAGAKPSAQWQRLADALRITQEGQHVNLYIDQLEPVLEQLIQLLPAQAKP